MELFYSDLNHLFDEIYLLRDLYDYYCDIIRVKPKLLPYPPKPQIKEYDAAIIHEIKLLLKNREFRSWLNGKAEYHMCDRNKTWGFTKAKFNEYINSEDNSQFNKKKLADWNKECRAADRENEKIEKLITTIDALKNWGSYVSHITPNGKKLYGLPYWVNDVHMENDCRGRKCKIIEAQCYYEKYMLGICSCLYRCNKCQKLV